MNLGILDIILLISFLVASTLIGLYHGIKGLKQTSVDYLLGSRMMKPLPLAMSLAVGTVSSITVMGNAGEMYAHGTQIWMMDLGMALGMVFVAKYFIPIFYPLKMVSLYHFIESRFHSIWLRKGTVIITICGAYVFIGFLLFPLSLFLKGFTGFSTTTNIVITGLVGSIYSSFGGVKAVVYTDVLQSIVMIGGSLAIVLQGAWNVGGLGTAWDIAYHRGRIEFFNFDLDPYQRHSFWLVIVYGFFFSLSTYGVNQSQTQRTFSASSVKEAQRVIYYAIVGMLFLKGLINLSGITIFANFADCDPLASGDGRQQSNIMIVVKYVEMYLVKVPGFSGLFVASIYAAVLSSVSTQVNSMTALIWEDFLKDLSFFENWKELNITRLQKILVFLMGMTGIFTSLIAAKFSSFLYSLFLIVGAVWGPMVGLFLIAIYLPWVKCRGAALGFFVAIMVSGWIVLGQVITQPPFPYLPMSYEGCSSEILVKNVTNMTTEPNSLVNATTPVSRLNHGTGFYGISYCLSHCWGVLASITVAVIFTLFTSANTLSDVDEKLIHPAAWKCFTRGLKITFIDIARCYVKPKRPPKTREIETISKNNDEESEPM